MRWTCVAVSFFSYLEERGNSQSRSSSPRFAVVGEGINQALTVAAPYAVVNGSQGGIVPDASSL